MLQGLEVMLKRMETHPEEFVVQNKYTKAIHRVRPFLTEEESEALKQALVVAHRDYFNGEVLSIISGETSQGARGIMVDDYEDTSLINIISSNVSFKDKLKNSLFGGVNTITAPSAFGAVPLRAEGMDNTKEDKF